MSGVVETVEEARAGALPPLLVLRPLEAFLDERGLGSGPLSAEPIGEGHSNVTFLLRRGGEEWVLRRPPRPPIPPSAHDVLREHRVLDAIKDAVVRVPRPVCVCADESVIGAPFYLMERVEGEVVGAELPAWLEGAAARRAVTGELIDALAEVHAVDWRACGLDGFGRPTGYLERQLRRFTDLWEVNQTRELPLVDRLTEWLGPRLPESPPATIVHGDYRLGNAAYDRATLRLVAIFDWEMATIGDPLADVGYLTATWGGPAARDLPALRQSRVTAEPGFPPREELVARYEERTGRRVEHLRWYQVLALWRAVIFLEGSYKRFLAGTTDDPFFAGLGDELPLLAEHAWGLARA